MPTPPLPNIMELVVIKEVAALTEISAVCCSGVYKEKAW
jgi:hypothetical protein